MSRVVTQSKSLFASPLASDGDVPAVKRSAFSQRCAENNAAAGGAPRQRCASSNGNGKQYAAGWKGGRGQHWGWRKAGGKGGGSARSSREPSPHGTQEEEEEVRGDKGW